MVTSLDRPKATLPFSRWQVCLKSSRSSEEDRSTKILPGDENDNPALIGLNIRITEFYVKQKGAIKTGSLEPDNQKIGIPHL
jgi:hypothetical protein